MAYYEGEISGVNTNNGNGFMNGDGFWAIILLALIFGWNRGGFGGSGTEGASNNYVLVSDFAQIERKLDTITAGICDATYALNNGIMTQGYETRNAIAGVGTQLGSCCCEIKSGIADLKYASAINTRDLIDNQNANTRAILDKLCQQEIDAKNERIAEQNQKIFALELASSQANQNAYLLNELKPCPRPAYITCNPYATYNTNGNGCSCSSL